MLAALIAFLGCGVLTQAIILPSHSKNVAAIDLTKLEKSAEEKVNVSGVYADCYALRKAGYRTNGTYTLTLNGTVKEVRCYFDNVKAYTIIQQRIRGDVDFNQRLNEYANGFGTVSGDHWIGLNTIRHLVELGNNQLQITLTSWPPSQTVIVNYGYFSIGIASQGWPLSVGSYYGAIPDDLSYSNGRVFYTSDVPDPNRCAVNQRGGWWYNYCSYAFLNGYYYRGGRYTPPSNYYDGIYWKDWLGYDYSLMQVTMAVTHA